MALRDLMPWAWADKSHLVGRAQGITQTVVIQPAVLQYVVKHHQRTGWTTEAGGQLFGLITPAQVCIQRATGPYGNDERTRFRYRSDPRAAQSAIESQAKRALLYLGEWHTHAEDIPTPSHDDFDAVKSLLARSKLNASGLLLLIVGGSPPPSGLALLSFDGVRVLRWELSCRSRIQRGCRSTI